MSIDKYVGCSVIIIYQDGRQQVSQRKIHIKSVKNGTVFAFDALKGMPRRFRLDRILAIQPVIHHAS